MLKQITNLFLVYSIVRKLTLPFEHWDAFKAGVIDKNGNILIDKDKRTKEQSDSLSLFDVLIMNIKKLLAKIPGGSSKFATYTAAAFLLKESDISKLENYLTESTEYFDNKKHYEIISEILIPLSEKYSKNNALAESISQMIGIPKKSNELAQIYMSLIGEEIDETSIRRKVETVFSATSVYEDVVPVNTVGTGNIAGTTVDTMATNKKNKKRKMIYVRRRLEAENG